MAEEDVNQDLTLNGTYIHNLMCTQSIFILCSTHVVLQHFLVKNFRRRTTQKSHSRLKKSAANARKELPVRNGAAVNINVSNIFAVTRHVKPHKVLLTSQTQLFSGCGLFTMRSVFVSFSKGISKIMKSPGP